MLAAAKSATVVNKLIQLRDNTKKKEEYTINARKIVNIYNTYSATEYNTMVHRVRIAKQFEKFQEERHLYPNIEWLPSRAAEPDRVHRTYWYHVWAQDDPFWHNNFPGCRWGCKCSWRTTDAPVTPKQGMNMVPPSPGLEGNPYFTQEIISHNHPYYRNIPKHISKTGVLHNPDELVYVRMKDEYGNEYQEHYLCRFYDEITENRKTASILLQNGFKNIKLLPQIHASETELRKRYFGKDYTSEGNPDAVVDGQLTEFKHAFGKGKSLYKNISNQLNKAARKSNTIVLVSENEVSIESLSNLTNSIFKRYKNLKQIIIAVNNRIYFKALTRE